MYIISSYTTIIHSDLKYFIHFSRSYLFSRFHPSDHPVSNPIHCRNNDQGQKRRKSQSINYGPGHRSPNFRIITPDIDLWIEIRNQGKEIYIQANRQRHQSQYGGNSRQQNGSQPSRSTLNYHFPDILLVHLPDTPLPQTFSFSLN